MKLRDRAQVTFIAVSQRSDNIESRAETRDALDQRLIGWVRALGALPLPVPNALGDELAVWLKTLSPEAVLLSGGNDIGGCPERDRTETELLDYAERAGLPVLGICRGMQMLAHHAGGILLPVSSHAGTRHPLLGDAVASGEMPAEVNSFHNWGLAACPQDYAVLATAPDGSIEAMRHGKRRWEGWMWHPEREAPFGETELARARQLLIGD
ncbi:gamma-glutamyl-gamma-aminobutyrate hydrolase [Methyloversatilis discipulorum]|jgi:N5-(cytidine 5'-diphosphoramidyl)-L-glutamine hydrolase|uniref:gamma-glutamyl-gamma-aminobutyrate hydrolase n=1 Tax=Methyloversatilis discipulorum TaxID=1119528 RepID=UPI000380B484|nr:gamma-glutamyl-gamma-aminobutyrate hydrolase [Methyloversatilis discipulorum]